MRSMFIVASPVIELHYTARAILPSSAFRGGFGVAPSALQAPQIIFGSAR